MKRTYTLVDRIDKISAICQRAFINKEVEYRAILCYKNCNITAYSVTLPSVQLNGLYITFFRNCRDYTYLYDSVDNALQDAVLLEMIGFPLSVVNKAADITICPYCGEQVVPGTTKGVCSEKCYYIQRADIY